jgi:hypothetical protein
MSLSLHCFYSFLVVNAWLERNMHDVAPPRNTKE